MILFNDVAETSSIKYGMGGILDHGKLPFLTTLMNSLTHFRRRSENLSVSLPVCLLGVEQLDSNRNRIVPKTRKNLKLESTRKFATWLDLISQIITRKLNELK